MLVKKGTSQVSNLSDHSTQDAVVSYVKPPATTAGPLAKARSDRLVLLALVAPSRSLQTPALTRPVHARA